MRGQLIPDETFVFQGVRNDKYIGLRDGVGTEGDVPRDLAQVPPDSRLEPFSASVDEANYPDGCATDIGGNANKIVETLLRRSIQYPIIPENSRPPGFVPGQRRLHTASSNAHSITIRPFSNSYSLASGLPLLTTEVPSYSVTDCVTFCDCDANCLKFGQNPAGSASLLQRFSVRLLGSLATPFGRFLPYHGLLGRNLATVRKGRPRSWP